jgi:hypothetical protein
MASQGNADAPRYNDSVLDFTAGWDESHPVSSIMDMDATHASNAATMGASGSYGCDELDLLSTAPDGLLFELDHLITDNLDPSPQASHLSSPGALPLTYFDPERNEQIPLAPAEAVDSSAKLPPKIGTRFSKDSLRVLRTWLTAHSSYPFPNDQERHLLQLQTGLTKTQILNWLANARRRGKLYNHHAAPSRGQGDGTRPIDIPQRPGTPAPRDHASPSSPLKRWVDSPPEHEPATVTAIARAVELNATLGRIPLVPQKKQMRNKNTQTLPVLFLLSRSTDSSLRQ